MVVHLIRVIYGWREQVVEVMNGLRIASLDIVHSERLVHPEADVHVTAIGRRLLG